jgi:hypothetical protein
VQIGRRRQRIRWNTRSNDMDTRKARRMGYYVQQGEYQGTTDNRLGRWYIGREGHPFRPDGTGHPTARAAWAAVVAVTETPDACDARKAAARAMLAALNGLLNAGGYNNEGEWVLPSGQWDGQGEPPDVSDHPAMQAAEAAIAQAEAAGIVAEE